MASEILVPQPGIELAPLILEVQNLNHQTTREVPLFFFFGCFKVSSFVIVFLLYPSLHSLPFLLIAIFNYVLYMSSSPSTFLL